MPFISAFSLPWLESQAVAKFAFDAIWVVCVCRKASDRLIELGAALPPLEGTFPTSLQAGRADAPQGHVLQPC